MSKNYTTKRKSTSTIRTESEFWMKKLSNNLRNKAWIIGIVHQEFNFWGELKGEKFYKTKVRVSRISETEDYVPILVSEKLLENIEENTFKEKAIEVCGEFRSRNKLGEDGINHVELFLLANSLKIYEFEEKDNKTNLIYLEGTICNPPYFKVKSSGIKITSLIVAINREDGSDYIPCITWNNMACYAKDLKVGDKIKIYGRIQSREYHDFKDGKFKENYEVSIIKLMKR